jgi:hypothetical protein
MSDFLSLTLFSSFLCSSISLKITSSGDFLGLDPFDLALAGEAIKRAPEAQSGISGGGDTVRSNLCWQTDVYTHHASHQRPSGCISQTKTRSDQ